MGIRLENLDTSVKPGDDFFQFADGGWNAAHPLTDEYARYGSFEQLAEDNREQLKSLIDGIVTSTLWNDLYTLHTTRALTLS